MIYSRDLEVISQKLIKNHFFVWHVQGLNTLSLLKSLVIVLVARHVQHFCDVMDCSLPGSFVHGILQGRILKWVAISFSRGTSQPREDPKYPELLNPSILNWQVDSLPQSHRRSPLS